MADPAPVLLAHYSLCTADCEGTYHVPDFKTCDRCGSLIHKAIFEVDHPTLGEVTVGSECFKDVMGYAWKKSHENAVVLHKALADWVKRWDAAHGESTERVKVKWRQGKRASVDIPGTERAFVRETGYSAHRLWTMKLPHGFNDTIIRAGADLGLWEVGEGHKRDHSDAIDLDVDLTRPFQVTKEAEA